ncbi:MAG: hypothetical protein ACK53X_03200 [Holosporales bacterium]
MVKKYLQKTYIVLSLSRINKVYAGGKKPPRTMEQQNEHQQYVPPPTSQNNNISPVDHEKITLARKALYTSYVTMALSTFCTIWNMYNLPQHTPDTPSTSNTPHQVQKQTAQRYPVASACAQALEIQKQSIEEMNKGPNTTGNDLELKRMNHDVTIRAMEQAAALCR